MRRIAALLGLCLLACGGDSGGEPPGELRLGDDTDGPSTGDGSSTCVDADGDGYGARCEAGPDCNDSDDTVFEDCPACMRAERGCACAPGSAPVACMVTSADVSGDEPLCKDGQRFCRDGVWTECIGIVNFAP